MYANARSRGCRHSNMLDLLVTHAWDDARRDPSTREASLRLKPALTEVPRRGWSFLCGS